MNNPKFHELKRTFDHRTLVAKDDPQLEFFKEGAARGLFQLIVVDHVGCEMFAELVYLTANRYLRSKVDLRGTEVKIVSVEVAV
jgi:6-pyruvoyltetrahydropterin/6-carboxytetrahydropterin synthase